MAAAHADCSGQEETMATFHPTLWGDYFLTHQPQSSGQQPQMRERMEVLLEQVRTVIKESNGIQNVMELILSLERLGLDYHYENEIGELLDVVLNSDYDDNNLQLVSLRFYLLRKNRYDVSSDVFNKFQDREGDFFESDTNSLLSLYSAAHMRTKGEQVLDKAIYFTKKHLLGALVHLESPFVEEVSSALLTPPFRRVRILEARSYIPCYEKEATRNEAILELAKLNFNILQLHFCEELKEVTLWWQKLKVGPNLSFIRDRIVETYFWINGTSYNRKYSYSRIIATKITAFMTIIDDILDTYGSTEESMQLAEAINRWDEGAVDVLPEYMKDIYLYLLETFHSFEEHLGPEKSYRVVYLKESFKKLVQAYTAELKWRDEKYVPKKISEHLEVSTISIGTAVVACAFFVGMDDINAETFNWLSSETKLLKSFAIFVRLTNDMASTEREQQGVHCASTIQSYMKEHETTKYDACEKIKELIENSWNDILKHYLELIDQPMVVPQIILDLSRTVDNMYKHTDAYTNSETIKDTIRMLFVDPME
ncbi:beta-sesquiphellandrene synthase-like [Aegilops tauschii subsp. strangulata]|uniref:beta-sesquiphellandrene synthase-like n=1 Tax=Aegilops tauschii subsp. strangulata TaxID=200361 RepID=UPI001ABCCE74|nr:beta-sesquiphellandrene synthase-like [Aegilops tauschii subsp. strangulata]